MKRAASLLLPSRTLILMLCTAALVANSISAKTSSSTGSTGSQAGSKTASSSAPDAAKTPSSPGGGGGTLSIESTMLAYLALSEDARKIAEAIQSTVKGQNVIVATPADLAAILQWRIVMGQGELLHTRAYAALKSAKQAMGVPEYRSVVPQKEAAVGGAPFISSVGDVATLIQTVASIFAVNESVSSNAGSLNSSPLLNFLAAELHGTQLSSVYVLSAYTH